MYSNLVVNVESKLLTNIKGDKFKVQWYMSEEGPSMLVTALLLDVKEYTAALYEEEPLGKTSNQEEQKSEAIKI